MANKVEYRMRMLVVVMCLRNCRSNCCPWVMQELVLQARGHVCDRIRSSSVRFVRDANRAASSR